MSQQTALLTGPVDRNFELADGTQYDCSPYEVVCESKEHAIELAHLIGLHYEAAGHPALVDENGIQKPFVYDRPDLLPGEVAPGVTLHAEGYTFFTPGGPHDEAAAPVETPEV